MNIYFYLLEFIVSVILVLLYYKFVETKAIKKYTKKSIPTDLKLFIYTTKVDVKKVNYKRLMKIVAIINAIDIGLIVVLTNITKSFLLKLLIALVASIIVLFISYKLIGFIFKVKGMTHNES